MNGQKAFVFDVNKCTGCAACQIACSIENRVDAGISWRSVHTFNPRHVPGVPSFHHSIACNHCVDPPCMKHCPALAYSKDPSTGAVTINADSCIGCKLCEWHCPDFAIEIIAPGTEVADVNALIHEWQPSNS